jgi:glutamyl-tRNA reductase
MPICAIGLSHHTTPIWIRERLAVPPHRLPETLSRLKRESGIREVVLLSTCNRFELYLHTREGAAEPAMCSFLSMDPDLAVSESHLYRHESSAAARHLFRVVSGLDSQIIGENEILGQVKNAYRCAQTAGTTGKLMNVLFQRGLCVGKRIRCVTGLSRKAGSIGSAAVAMAEKVLGSLAESRVMILGAGEMAECTARHLLSRNVRSMLVSNRTYERACELARTCGGIALRFEEGMARMSQADIVICSTAAPHPIIGGEQVRRVMAERKGRPLIFIDIAVPRDVSPDVECFEGAHVYNLDDLQAIVDRNLHCRMQSVQAAEEMIEEKTQEFERWLQELENSPRIKFCSRDPVLTTP